MSTDSLSGYKTQRRNANKHTARGFKALDDSIREDGWIGAMTAAADGETFDGSARLEKATDIYGADVEPLVVHTSGDRPIIVVRDDIPNTEDPRAQRLALRANRVAELDLDWDIETLASFDAEMLGNLWTPGELENVYASALQDADDSEGASTRRNLATPSLIRLVVDVANVGMIEQAIKATGENNRAQAIAKIFGEYLADNAKRQHDEDAKNPFAFELA